MKSVDRKSASSVNCARVLSTLNKHITAISMRGGLDALNDVSRAELESRPDFPELQRLVLEAARLEKDLETVLSVARAAGRNILSGVPADLIDFYEGTVSKKRAHLRRLADLCRPGITLADLLSVSDYQEAATGGRDVAATIEAAVEYWGETLEPDDERRTERFDFPRTNRLIESPWFQPDAWLRNEDDLTPVMIEGSSDLPNAFTQRLNQAFFCFVFGQYLACIALARATLEQALKLCAARRGVSVVDPETKYPVDFDTLIDRFTGVEGVQGTIEEMHYVRRSANEVLHAPHAGRVFDVPQDKQIALRCIRNLRRCLPALTR